jgi:hypothetical protein
MSHKNKIKSKTPKKIGAKLDDLFRLVDKINLRAKKGDPEANSLINSAYNRWGSVPQT